MGTTAAMGKTLFDKVWEQHVVKANDDGSVLLYIDRHLVHEVTSPQAFEGLRHAGRAPWRTSAAIATPDHNVPTTDRAKGIADPVSRTQVEALDTNCREFGITEFGMDDVRQGIVHVVGPEQGLTLPGMTVVCGDSHTATHGAFGAIAMGIGTSEVEHVLATECLIQKKPKRMRITVDGDLPNGITGKDVALFIIGHIGTAGGTGYAIEFAGSAIRQLSMEGRMSLCNMAIEAGARCGMVAVDDTTIDYVKGRPYAPKAEVWEQAVAAWRELHSDADAVFDKEIALKAADIVPQVSWGTSPEMVLPVTDSIPSPEQAKDAVQAEGWQRALAYMDLQPGTKIADIPVDKVFIGSCTNGRIEDFRAAAEIVKGRKVAANVKLAMAVPGSGLVKQQAEAEGLDKIFTEAGFEWREPGCSMCLAMNADRLEPGERCASTSNRNFEGRQGMGGRTHLVSPAMAAAAAIAGHFVDVRSFDGPKGNKEITMQAFTQLKGIVAPLDRANVDTDAIIPKQFLKSIKRSGYGPYLFDEWRYEDRGEPEMDCTHRPRRKDFVLNQPRYQRASILLARENFGCGSSREHAPWALLDYGFRCVIAPSFADIFYNNCFKNGILPIVLDAAIVDRLFKETASNEGYALDVDLEKQTVTTPAGEAFSFEVDEFRKHCLLNGLDDIGLTLQVADDIRAYEAKRKEEAPWLFC